MICLQGDEALLESYPNSWDMGQPVLPMVTDWPLGKVFLASSQAIDM